MFTIGGSTGIILGNAAVDLGFQTVGSSFSVSRAYFLLSWNLMDIYLSCLLLSIFSQESWISFLWILKVFSSLFPKSCPTFLLFIVVSGQIWDLQPNSQMIPSLACNPVLSVPILQTFHLFLRSPDFLLLWIFPLRIEDLPEMDFEVGNYFIFLRPYLSL